MRPRHLTEAGGGCQVRRDEGQLGFFCNPNYLVFLQVLPHLQAGLPVPGLGLLPALHLHSAARYGTLSLGGTTVILG